MAIQSESGGYVAAKVASIFTTSDITKWKCSDQFDAGWKNTQYEDSKWIQAVGHGSASLAAVQVANIWTSNQDNKTVYCRGHMGERSDLEFCNVIII